MLMSRQLKIEKEHQKAYDLHRDGVRCLTFDPVNHCQINLIRDSINLPRSKPGYNDRSNIINRVEIHGYTY